MGIRWTEEEAKAAGFIKAKDGSWHRNSDTKVRLEGSRQVSGRKQAFSNVSKEKTRNEARSKAPSEKSDRRFGIVVTGYRWNNLDPDNLLPKWYIDELVVRGILPSDSSSNILWIQKKVVKIPRTKEENTVVEIYEQE